MGMNAIALISAFPFVIVQSMRAVHVLVNAREVPHPLILPKLAVYTLA
jgi:hypothetical protein